jgi:tetratricopeptide (TPR) repeat protein
MRTTRDAALLALLALGACDRPDDQPTGSISADDVRAAAEQFTPEVRAALDSGNAAYRRDDFQSALAYYERAAAADENAAPAWFGVFMAQRELGDTVAAARALERVRELAPGATILHDEASE